MSTRYYNNDEVSAGGGYGWLSFLVGLISIIVGIWCICTPTSSIVALTWLFIIGLFAEGFFEIVLACCTTNTANWIWRLVAGIVEILLGIWVCLLPPEQATIILIYIVGFWIFFSSISGIGESIILSGYKVRGWGWMLACNICGVACSFLFLLGPIIGAWVTVLFAGCAFVTYGIYRCLFAWT